MRIPLLALLALAAPAAAIPPPPPVHFVGPNALAERFTKPLYAWLADALAKKAAFRLITVQEISNEAAVLLEERTGGPECRVHWTTLTVTDEAAGVGPVQVQRFGGDCCEGSPCERSPAGHHLHLLNALQTRNWQAVAAHVPAGGSVAFELVVPDGTSRETWTRADLEAGKINPPGCASVNTQPSCQEGAPKDGQFECRCDGGGYHVTYRYRLTADPKAPAILESVRSEES